MSAVQTGTGRGLADDGAMGHIGLEPPTDLPAVTRWVDELVHRYVFERAQCEKHQSSAAIFLETELLKELFFLAREHDDAVEVIRHRTELVRHQHDGEHQTDRQQQIVGNAHQVHP